MSDDDLKSVIATYQQKAFELFNQNIVLETQINSLKSRVDLLTNENEKLKRSRKVKSDEEIDYK